MKITWNFFATSHRKGVVDGIRGTLKRAVWRQVKAERAHVMNYLTLGKQVCPNIHTEFIPKDDIAQQTTFLDAKWENTRAVPRTHHVHCVKSHGSDKVKVSDTSDDTDVRKCQIQMTILKESPGEETTVPKMHTLDVQLGQCVVVVYDRNEYPGEVTSISDTDGVQVRSYIKVEVATKDMIFYDKNDIVRTINPPLGAGHRVFNDLL